MPHCKIDELRSVTTLPNTRLDMRLVEKAHAYAANAGMEFGDFIDAALAHYMITIDEGGVDPTSL